MTEKDNLIRILFLRTRDKSLSWIRSTTGGYTTSVNRIRITLDRHDDQRDNETWYGLILEENGNSTRVDASHEDLRNLFVNIANMPGDNLIEKVMTALR